MIRATGEGAGQLLNGNLAIGRCVDFGQTGPVLIEMGSNNEGLWTMQVYELAHFAIAEPGVSFCSAARAVGRFLNDGVQFGVEKEALDEFATLRNLQRERIDELQICVATSICIENLGNQAGGGLVKTFLWAQLDQGEPLVAVGLTGKRSQSQLAVGRTDEHNGGRVNKILPTDLRQKGQLDLEHWRSTRMSLPD